MFYFRLFSFFVFLIISSAHLKAQETSSKDSSQIAAELEARRLDSLKANSEIKTTVFYKSEDSLVYVFGSREMFMHGQGSITYGKISLDAEEIYMDVNKNLVQANGKLDTTNTMKGLPIFKEGEKVYNTNDITYNMKTKRAIISGIVTQENQGFIHGEQVRKDEQNNFYMNKSIYTTCNLEHPHFAIHSTRLQMTPGKHVASDLFYMTIADVATPIGFPVALFPLQGRRASGIIIPTYGESQDRGFFLRDGGLYLALGKYVDFKALASIYTLGGWGLNARLNYKVRYVLSGNFNFRYTRRIGEVVGQQNSLANEFFVDWVHTPVTRGASRYGFNVHMGTQNFLRNNSFNTADFLSTSFLSSANYSTSFLKIFRFSSNLRLEQNILTGVSTLTPGFNFSMNQIFPFKKLFNSQADNLLTKLSLSYSTGFSTRINNVVERQNAEGTTVSDTIDFFDNFTKIIDDPILGARHSIPISTSINILKYITLNPSFNLTLYTYPQRLEYTFDPETNSVQKDTVETLSVPYDYSTGVGFSTRLYSFFYFKGGAILRSQWTPNFGFSYKPDFSKPQYGFYANFKDTAGNEIVRSKYEGALFTAGGPGRGESKSISFGLSNVIELKIKDKSDSTGEKTKKIKFFDNISASSSYNAAADSFQLANFNLSARTSLFKLINLNLGATLDPYYYEPLNVGEGATTGFRRTSRLASDVNGQLGKIISFNVTSSVRLNPEVFKKKAKGSEAKGLESLKDKAAEEKYGKEVVEDIRNNAFQYVDFNIPWNLNINYNIRRSQSTQIEPEIVQTLNISGDLKLTDNWKIGFNTGYDFKTKKPSFTSFNIFRDLHCWQMTFNWVPFGPRQSYNFTIQVKASVLQDLKLNKRDSWFDRRAAF